MQKNQEFVKLVNLLKNGSEVERVDAVFEITTFNEDAVQPLISSLNDNSSAVRAAAIQSLERFEDKRAVDPLIELLNDTDSYVRSKSAEVLGEWKILRAVDPLIMRLTDENFHVRKDTAVALGKIGDKEAVEALIERLSDFEMIVRFRAIGALGLIGDERALSALHNIQQFYNSDDPFASERVLNLLATKAISMIEEKHRI